MPRKKRGRYANVKKVKDDGFTFDSQREFRRYHELKLLVAAGHIKNLEVHPRIPIIIGGVPVKYFPSNRQMVWEADFRYFDIETGERITEDVKMQSGFRTEIYKFKRALIHTMGLKILET